MLSASDLRSSSIADGPAGNLGSKRCSGKTQKRTFSGLSLRSEKPPSGEMCRRRQTVRSASTHLTRERGKSLRAVLHNGKSITVPACPIRKALSKSLRLSDFRTSEVGTLGRRSSDRSQLLRSGGPSHFLRDFSRHVLLQAIAW